MKKTIEQPIKKLTTIIYHSRDDDYYIAKCPEIGVICRDADCYKAISELDSLIADWMTCFSDDPELITIV